MTEQFFFNTVEEYKSQLRKYNLKIDFVMALKLNGRSLQWPQEVSSLIEKKDMLAKLYPGRLELQWEGKRIGEYYWAGELDEHKHVINHLLLDNFINKIHMLEQTKYTLSCGIGILNSAIKAIEAKDQYTRGHSDRVSTMAMEISRIIEADCSEFDLEFASKLHDIGKIGISDWILCKPGQLTDEETAEIRRHPEIGADILKPMPIFEHLIPAIRHHHERFDGNGYPDRLKGNEIPLLSRIITVADTFDALTSNRPYRKATSVENALEIIYTLKGSQLDPEIVEAFLAIPRYRLTRLVAS